MLTTDLWIVLCMPPTYHAGVFLHMCSECDGGEAAHPEEAAGLYFLNPILLREYESIVGVTAKRSYDCPCKLRTVGIPNPGLHVVFGCRIGCFALRD